MHSETDLVAESQPGHKNLALPETDFALSSFFMGDLGAVRDDFK
jgi:hypothetical protein